MYALKEPEAPGERDRLVREEADAMLADAMMTGDARAIKELTALTQKLKPGAPAKAAAPETKPEPEKVNDEPYTEDWRAEVAADIERLAGVEPGMARGCAGTDPSADIRRAERPETKAAVVSHVPAGAARYTGSAAGPFADMVVNGRTRRGEDAGGGGICALGGAEGGIPLGGAGGADLSRCARSDGGGASGLLATEPDPGQVPVWQPSRHRLEWANGAVAYGFSAEDPEALRGPQFDLAWCDEAAAWTKGETAWDNLQLALRLGPHPLAMVTTTPRPVALIRRLMNDPSVVVTRTPMAENAGNLAPGYVEAMQAAYGNTQLGRQELDGELIDDPPGALFLRTQIDALRVAQVPDVMDDRIVAVDPNISARPGADACGIVLAGVKDGVAYVLGDASAPGLAPLEWARRAAALAERGGASAILAEANQGGDMVRRCWR